MPYGTSESVTAQAAKLEGLLQSAATAIVIIDAAGAIENVNPATARMFGYEPAELVGQNVKILMPDNYRAEHDQYIANYLATGVKKIIGIGREVSGLRKDGTIFPIHLGQARRRRAIPWQGG
jgi:PAS domain S-box-containing protein